MYLQGNLRVRLATQRRSLRNFNLRPLATLAGPWAGLKLIQKAKNFKFIIFQGLARTRHADVDLGLGDVAAVGVDTSKRTVGKPANCVKSSKRLNGIREVTRANLGLANSFRSLTGSTKTPVLLKGISAVGVR